MLEDTSRPNGSPSPPEVAFGLCARLVEYGYQDAAGMANNGEREAGKPTRTVPSIISSMKIRLSSTQQLLEVPMSISTHDRQ